MSRLLNRANRTLISKTIALLEIEPHHQVLEIGFGGGSALALIAASLRTGSITGIDFSGEMVKGATSHLRPEIAAGRVRVQSGDASRLEFSDECFDRVFTVNTIYFWSDPLRVLAEIRRVLKTGGRTAVSLRPKEKMQKFAVTNFDFHLYEPQEVSALVERCGFRDVRVLHDRLEKFYDDVVVVGTK